MDIIFSTIEKLNKTITEEVEYLHNFGSVTSFCINLLTSETKVGYASFIPLHINYMDFFYVRSIFVEEAFRGKRYGQTLRLIIEDLILQKNSFPDVGLLVDTITRERAYERRENSDEYEFDYHVVGMYTRNNWEPINYGSRHLIFNPHKRTIHSRVKEDIKNLIRI